MGRMVTLRPSLPRKLLGIGCLLMGPIGVVLPVVPGVVFVALGVFVLREQYVWAARGVDMIRTRWPQMLPAIEERERRMLDWFRTKFARFRRG